MCPLNAIVCGVLPASSLKARVPSWYGPEFVPMKLTCTVQVNFIGTNSGPYQLGTLAFNDDAGNTPQTIALSGHIVQPAVSLSTSSLPFGNQLVGTRSANQSVVVTNSGSATLNIGTATAPAPFAIATDGCSNTVVAVGSSCTIQANFAPTAPGPASPAPSIPHDAPTSPPPVAPP